MSKLTVAVLVLIATAAGAERMMSSEEYHCVRRHARTKRELAVADHFCPRDCGCAFHSYRAKIACCRIVHGVKRCSTNGMPFTLDPTEITFNIPGVHWDDECICQAGYQACRILKWQAEDRLTGSPRHE